MHVSPLTLLCRETVPSISSRSSRHIGWTSLLLDHHRGVAFHDPYTSVATPDARIGVSLAGRYACDFMLNGRWRNDVHAPGTICVHRTGVAERYRFPRPRDADCSMALIYLPVDLLAATQNEMRRPGQPTALPRLQSIVSSDPAITQMAVALLWAMDRQESDLYAESAAAWLSVHLLARFGSGPAQEQDARRVEIPDRRISRVIDFIAAHYSEPLTLDRLAAEACVSKFHFTRLFRQKTGTTPYDHLIRVRLEAARHLLHTTAMPVGAIAAAVGYASVSRFSTAFAMHHGRAPKDYRLRPDA